MRNKIPDPIIVGYYNVYRQKYFYGYNLSMVNKGVAIEQLFKLMKSFGNYSKKELSAVLNYGLVTIKDNFVEIPDDVKLDERNPLQTTQLNKARTLLFVETGRKMLLEDFEKALTELEKVQ